MLFGMNLQPWCSGLELLMRRWITGGQILMRALGHCGDVPNFQILGSCTIAFGAHLFLTALNGGSRCCGSAKRRFAVAAGDCFAGEFIYGIQNMA